YHQHATNLYYCYLGIYNLNALLANTSPFHHHPHSPGPSTLHIFFFPFALVFPPLVLTSVFGGPSSASPSSAATTLPFCLLLSPTSASFMGESSCAVTVAGTGTAVGGA